jgi:hypothetical protein
MAIIYERTQVALTLLHNMQMPHYIRRKLDIQTVQNACWRFKITRVMNKTDLQARTNQV